MNDEKATPAEDTAGPAPGTSGSWSSKPEVDGTAPVTVPGLGLKGTLLFLWRQLTSMQTALILLMLLAIAAVPGSLYPQRSVNPGLTDQFLEENGRWGEILDTLGFFNVFSSSWFSAIYLLLFISLIGCIVPRVACTCGSCAKPPRTSRLTRFTGYPIELPGVESDALLERAHRALRRSRYRTVVREERASRSVSAERGLLRESGNLLFHIALVGVLICIAGGQLTSYRGQITVIEGDGFANSLTRYDSFESGAWFDESHMPDFRFTLEDFRASYVQPGEAGTVGEPRSFEADVRVTTPGQEELTRTLQVNKPLHVDGASMYLLGNGYAPEVTVTDPEGDVVAEGPVITVPMGDIGYTSQLVIKAPDARPEQTAVVGFFLPTGTIDEQGPRSLYPDALDPARADRPPRRSGPDDGTPQNAYEVDVSTLTPVAGRTAPGADPSLPRPGVRAARRHCRQLRRPAPLRGLRRRPRPVRTLGAGQLAGRRRRTDPLAVRPAPQGVGAGARHRGWRGARGCRPGPQRRPDPRGGRAGPGLEALERAGWFPGRGAQPRPWTALAGPGRHL